MTPLTIKDVLDALSGYPEAPPLPAPTYAPRSTAGSDPRIALITPSQERHTSDEAWQLFLGLRAGGFGLRGCGMSSTDVIDLLAENPAVAFVQDQHEWDTAHLPPSAPPGHLAVPEEHFRNSTLLASRPDVLKLTVVKDTHRQWESARCYSAAIGCHAWICYYNPAIVLRTLSWIRPEHLIRTWHTVDPEAVPPWTSDRLPCVLSGSLGGAYPLRTRIAEARPPEVTTVLRHPGYVNTGSHTRRYLQELGRHKVSIATASRFGYALRKIIESVACGCAVITDLPSDEVLPGIDAALTRVHPSIRLNELRPLIRKVTGQWNPDERRRFAETAKRTFDWRAEGVRLAGEIEKVRSSWA